jgi:predicted enzyme related to lactoylglutathione lyase
MSEKTSYAPGTPSWVDLGSPDPDAAVEFYGGLFGWDVSEGGDPEQTGGYRMAALRDKPVAGLMPLMQEGQPPAWTTYVSVADADATAAAVKEAGGSVLAEPMDVMDVGRMAVFADPAGAVFAIWQPRAHPGAGLVNEPGAFTWNELNTRDPDAAKAFYAAVFGWEVAEHDMGEMGTYVEWKQGEDPMGGMMDMRGRVPDEVPAHWLVYFAVEDTDAAVEKVKELGGGVAFGPIDIPAGRFAVVHDPHGAMFAVIKMPEETAAA